jgi:Kef-type K+ transport system membrane component KefB
LSYFAGLGVVFMLLRVGLKSHTSALLKKLPDASLIWIGDVLTNLAFGFIVSRYLLTLPMETSLIIATAFSATSVAVSVVVWDEARKLNTGTGQLLVDVAELVDLSGVSISRGVPNSVYTAMVLVAVMTSILAPLFLRRLL